MYNLFIASYVSPTGGSLGRLRAQQPTAYKLSLTAVMTLPFSYYRLLFAAAPAFALLLPLLPLVALLIIALLLVPDKHTTFECQAERGLVHVRGADNARSQMRRRANRRGLL